MKDFFKMTAATFLGLLVFTLIGIIIITTIVNGVIASTAKKMEMPDNAILTIDMSKITLTEQTQEMDVMSMISGNGTHTLGIYDAICAIYSASNDPDIKYIFMKPDAVKGGMAQIEELRNALEVFRTSGKPVISYIENPSNGGYYLASVSDKIYMTPHDGGMNNFTGISSQMLFVKDALDKLGVNVQLIRHGKYKSAGEMFIRNNSSKENMEQNKAMVASMWSCWADDICDSRNISTADLETMLNGLQLNFPADFLEKGLVDELLTREQLKEKLAVLSMVDSFDKVKSISLQDYAALSGPGNNNASKKVAVIYINGDIVDGQDNAKNVDGDRYARIIEQVRCDKAVKAVVLRVNSPGGSVLASEKIKTEIDLLKERVPVIASYGEYAASGGYWISAGCDYIFSNNTTLTGSIGVFSMIPDLSKTVNDKLHVNVTPVNSNGHSDMYSLMRPLTSDEVNYMQASVERIYDKFTSIVSHGRKMSVDSVDAIAQGRVWTGADAKNIGLVDEIGSIDHAILYAALCIEGVEDLGDVKIEEYPKPQTTMDMIMEALGETGNKFEILNWNPSMSGKVYARLPYIIDIK